MSPGEPIPIQTAVPGCFCCGQENPAGLKLRFFKVDEGTVQTSFTAPLEWTGWGDILHGGFQGLLLDETMSWVAWGLLGERAFVTKEIQVRYLRPVRVGIPLEIFGRLERDEGRQILTSGEIRDAAGTVLADARAIIVRVDPGKIGLKERGHQAEGKAPSR